MPKANTVPIYARVDIKKYVAIARWLKHNGQPNVTANKSRIIAATIDLLHLLLQRQESFEPIEDVEEALLLLDNWGIGLTDDRAKKAAANAIWFDEDFDISTLVKPGDEQEVDEIVGARIQELFKTEERP